MSFDLRAYLTKYGNVFKKHNDDKEWVIACLCDRRDGTREPHLWLNVDKQAGFCFRCRERYSLLEIVRLIEGCDSKEAFAIIRAGDTPESELRELIDALEPPAVDDPNTEEVERKVVLPDEYLPITKKRPDYLKEREVSLSDCVRHKIGVCKRGYFYNRVIVPVYDRDGALVSFVARWMGRPPDGIQKVLYPKGSRISKALWNVKRAAKHSTVVICEGVFDALRVGSNAVCLFGKHASQDQLSLLMTLGLERRLVVMLDPDASDDAEALAEELTEVCGDVRVASLPEGRKDPGECSPREIRRAVKRAAPLVTGADALARIASGARI